EQLLGADTLLGQGRRRGVAGTRVEETQRGTIRARRHIGPPDMVDTGRVSYAPAHHGLMGGRPDGPLTRVEARGFTPRGRTRTDACRGEDVSAAAHPG